MGRAAEGGAQGAPAAARVHAVTIKLSAAQVAQFEAACAAVGLPRSKAGAVAIVRWTKSVTE